MQKVVAVILNYYSSLDCKKCIKFIKEQDYEEISIIVIDNYSIQGEERDNLKKICKNHDVKLILNNTNNGFSAGNNIGLKEAIKEGASWCLVINPDVELRDKHYISYIMKEVKKWPEAVVVGSNMVLPNGKLQNPQRESSIIEEFFWPIQSIKAKLIKDFKWYLAEQKTGYCEKVCGGCFFIECNFLRDIGYLDENVFMYSEEAILSKQVISKGKKELYVNEVTSYHEHYEKDKKPTSMRMQKFIKSREYYINSYSGYNNFIKILITFSLRSQALYWRLKG